MVVGRRTAHGGKQCNADDDLPGRPNRADYRPLGIAAMLCWHLARVAVGRYGIPHRDTALERRAAGRLAIAGLNIGTLAVLVIGGGIYKAVK